MSYYIPSATFFLLHTQNYVGCFHCCHNYTLPGRIWHISKAGAPSAMGAAANTAAGAATATAASSRNSSSGSSSQQQHQQQLALAPVLPGTGAPALDAICSLYRVSILCISETFVANKSNVSNVDRVVWKTMSTGHRSWPVKRNAAITTLQNIPGSLGGLTQLSALFFLMCEYVVLSRK